MRTRMFLALAAIAVAATLLAGAAVAGYGGAETRTGANAAGAAKPKALFAVLSGRKEVDDEGRRGAGDPDGRGSFTATVDDGQLCFGITVANLDQPVGAHIHKARPNRNGEIVVELTPPADGDPGASSGCVAVAADLARAILKNPHKYYVNVHTAAFPDGAARGQLLRPSR